MTGQDLVLDNRGDVEILSCRVFLGFPPFDWSLFLLGGCGDCGGQGYIPSSVQLLSQLLFAKQCRAPEVLEQGNYYSTYLSRKRTEIE